MSSLLPNYEYDIFISYRQKDNKGDRWVTEFVNALKAEIEATFKEDISIYFDENPHDGLLETHQVGKSLEGKLKCLIFIPIISQTYCDPKSFAWENEFCAFNKLSNEDRFGGEVKLSNGNIGSRILPIKIHELGTEDKALLENELGGVLRAIEFIFKSAGVNRPLTPSDNPDKNQNKTFYRDQVNKAANSIKDIIAGLQGMDQNPAPAGSPETKSDPVQTPREQRQKRKRSFKFPEFRLSSGFKLPFIAATLAFVAVTILHFSEPAPDARIFRSMFLPPEKTSFSTSFGGHIALSPDGRFLAFVANDSLGKSLLWVRPLNALTGQALNGTEGAAFPFWSPDSRFIGFFTEGKVKKIEASGGPPQTLCNADGGRGGAWNDKGTIIFCPSGGAFPLYRVSAAGGSTVAITKLDTSLHQTSNRWPFFLPDGEHFIYTGRTGSGGVGEGDAIFLASLDTTFTPRLLTKSASSSAFANGHLLFAREQTLMALPFDMASLQTTGEAFPIAERLYFESLTAKVSFSVSDNGILAYQTGASSAGISLLWYGRDGEKTSAISQFSVYNDLRISPDGKRIATALIDQKSRTADVWLHEIDRDLWTRFTFDPRIDRWPIWSPDGSQIVFASGRKSHFDLFQRASSGAGSEELLLGSNHDKNATDWSRDGRFIAYDDWDPKTNADLWILPMSGDRKPFLFLQTEFSEERAAFSPDGRWIAYESNESGRSEVYIRPFPGPGGKWQVSTNGGIRPRWRRDGKELFYLAPDDKIMAADIKPSTANVDVGAVRPLFQFRPFGGGYRDIYDVTGDGKSFLVATPGGGENSSPVTLVVNWPGEIRK